MLAFQQIELPMNVEQSLPIGRALIQPLPPLLEEEVTVGTNALFFFSGQPGPTRGRANGLVLFLQECSFIYRGAREGRPQNDSGSFLREPAPRVGTMCNQ